MRYYSLIMKLLASARSAYDDSPRTLNGKGEDRKMPRLPRATPAGLHVPGHPPYAARTMDRGLSILQCFTATSPTLSAQELSQKMGIPYSTLYRYLTTLESGGYLARDGRSGLYRLGLRLVEHAGIVLNQIDARLQALPELEALADDVRLNSNLAVLFDGDTFHIGYAIRTSVPPIYTTLGRRAVAHCTALGKCLLAWLPRDDVHGLITEKGWRPYTPNSIQTFEALDHELDTVTNQGYAIDREERHQNLWCVGAPIRDRTGHVVAAMSVSAPGPQFRGEDFDRIIEAVVDHAERASLRLGHDPLLTVGP